MTSTTTLNDNLVKIDNLIAGLNYLLEELETRKKEFTDQDSIRDMVKSNVSEILNYDEYFTNKIARRVANDKWYDLVAHFEGRIESTINSIIKEHLEIAVEKELNRREQMQGN
jgi:hypothetical protein